MKYDIPFWDAKIDNNRIVDFQTILKDVSSVSIIGKGASIFHSNPLEIIKNSDFKILMNSVDIEYLEKYIGNKFDMQITTHISRTNSIIPVISKKNIKKYGIRYLMCNNEKSHKNGQTVIDYWRYFNNRVDYISCLPEFSKLNYSPDLTRFGPRLTIASSVLLLLYNIESVNKIIFVGVDAFHFGYSYRPNIKDNDKHFYPINEGGYNDPKSSHGIPFLNFLFTTIEEVNKKRRIEIHFPEILIPYINFPKKDYIIFYK